MRYIYIDESGETGRQSSFIVFASISTDHPRSLEKTAKKIWRAKPQLHKLGELHAHDVDDAIRTRVLKSLASLQGVAITHSTIDKSKQKKSLEIVYYIELAKFIKQHKDAQIVVVDKKDTTKKRQSIIKNLGLEKVFDGVEFKSSYSVKPLQMVDFVAWAIGRYYEMNDSTFYEMIKGIEYDK